MKNLVIAKRYAKTLFAVAEKEQVTATVLEEVIILKKILQDNQIFSSFLASPVNKIQQKIDLIQKAFSKSTPILYKFLLLLCKKKRIAFLADILGLFEKLYNESKGIKNAIVCSVKPLNDTELNKIKQTLDQKFSANFVLENKTDENLLGGFTVQIDDKIIDNSMKYKLELIEKNLLSVG